MPIQASFCKYIVHVWYIYVQVYNMRIQEKYFPNKHVFFPKKKQIEGMPIQASFCDNWYAACQDDKFCASDGGVSYYRMCSLTNVFSYYRGMRRARTTSSARPTPVCVITQP